MSDFTKDELYEVFEYLDDLRESGETNMFGAAPYISRDLGWDKNRAREGMSLWMSSYNGESSVTDRVERALNG